MSLYCDYPACWNAVTHEIVLSEGDCIDSCDYHITELIKIHADTKNPVHEVINIDTDEVLRIGQ